MTIGAVSLGDPLTTGAVPATPAGTVTRHDFADVLMGISLPALAAAPEPSMPVVAAELAPIEPIAGQAEQAPVLQAPAASDGAPMVTDGTPAENGIAPTNADGVLAFVAPPALIMADAATSSEAATGLTQPRARRAPLESAIDPAYAAAMKLPAGRAEPARSSRAAKAADRSDADIVDDTGSGKGPEVPECTHNEVLAVALIAVVKAVPIAANSVPATPPAKPTRNLSTVTQPAISDLVRTSIGTQHLPTIVPPEVQAAIPPALLQKRDAAAIATAASTRAREVLQPGAPSQLAADFDAEASAPPQSATASAKAVLLPAQMQLLPTLATVRSRRGVAGYAAVPVVAHSPDGAPILSRAPFPTAPRATSPVVEAAVVQPVSLPAEPAPDALPKVPGSRQSLRTDQPTQVETETLGPVTIALERGEGALRVHFTVDRGSTAHALIDSALLLDRSLAAAGTRLEQLSVDVRGGASSTAQADAGGQRQPTRDQRPTPRNVMPLTITPAAEPVGADRRRVASTPDRYA